MGRSAGHDGEASPRRRHPRRGNFRSLGPWLREQWCPRTSSLSCPSRQPSPLPLIEDVAPDPSRGRNPASVLLWLVRLSGWRELRSRLEGLGTSRKAGKILLIPANGGSGLPDTGDAHLIRKIRSAHERGLALSMMRADLRVESSELIIDHGDIVSAGGLLSWVDLGLHLAERFWGAVIADELSRVLVWDRSRTRQVPYSALGGPWIPLKPDFTLDPALVWARKHFRDKVSIAEWAHASGLGLRTLQRRWASVTETCGYNDPASFREIFERRVGWTPGRYRRSWRSRSSA